MTPTMRPIQRRPGGASIRAGNLAADSQGRPHRPRGRNTRPAQRCAPTLRTFAHSKKERDPDQLFVSRFLVALLFLRLGSFDVRALQTNGHRRVGAERRRGGCCLRGVCEGAPACPQAGCQPEQKRPRVAAGSGQGQVAARMGRFSHRESASRRRRKGASPRRQCAPRRERSDLPTYARDEHAHEARVLVSGWRPRPSRLP